MRSGDPARRRPLRHPARHPLCCRPHRNREQGQPSTQRIEYRRESGFPSLAGGSPRGLRNGAPAGQDADRSRLHADQPSLPRRSVRQRRRDARSAPQRRLRGALPGQPARQAPDLVDGRRPLPRRPRQRPGAEGLCLPGHRQHGGCRFRQMDNERPRLLSAIGCISLLCRPWSRRPRVGGREAFGAAENYRTNATGAIPDSQETIRKI